MKQLRAIRLLLAALLFAGSVACLIFGPRVHPVAHIAESSQLILSMIPVTMGAALVWLLLTFMFGRVYCSTVCPIGTLSDLFLLIRRNVRPLDRCFSYSPPSRMLLPVLLIYLVCLMLGMAYVGIIFEPWSIANNIAGAAGAPVARAYWSQMGVAAIVGMVAGIASFLIIAGLSLWRGRVFCSRWCPLGTAMGIAHQHALFHIEIDPDKCSGCGICEDICRSECIKVVSRYVDNSRCVRCFECVTKCPDDAIRFQINRNRPKMPLMKKVKSIK
ncbi:MAG: 4Fe-4S binding protein [Candidatus Amulumruptor caecigallinarius]|nr:4Fe-4S binding protein [Candidatus Amulumruptor caecigallinarius]